MELDPLLLSRIQFAFVVSFHAIFPVFTIGLAAYIAVLEGLLLKTGNPVWKQLSMFWTKVFAVVFALGVVSGLVMAFQFGTNWSNFSYATANFMGPVLSYEVVTAFFMEATFLGVLLFGRDKVPPAAHFFSAIMVSLGTFISSFWILSANSWMQTPGGFEMRDGIVHLTSWSEAIFNSSFPYRFAHMALAAFLTGGFVVAGVSAWHLVRNHAVEANKRALSMSMWLLLIIAPLQLVVGDFHGLNTLEEQPVKVAAMEGNWERGSNVPLLLFALPDQEAETNRAAIGLPGMASLILTHDINGVVPGITDVPKEERPPVALVFWSFRIMVGIGILMIVAAFAGLVLRMMGRLYDHRGFLQALRLMVPLPFIAVTAGWFTTELGRAPWLIYGVMTQAEGLTPSLTGGMALFSLIGFMLVYAVVFVVGIYYLTRLTAAGLTDIEAPPEHPERQRPKRPLSAADTPFDGDDLDFTPLRG
ncbi:cytochrome ubiquinol oxidase subunit I [Algiphilus sp.]|uniref:cytochrome ubiquinol oxidase subunit I n=1 Tax=Algiphilus sp. TaxID=1872431 RepID=UPI001CA6C416|nr:cytochrome ubiquinol oxidase subunit I [Algiphilus sp.]MBY8965892.1 cytochrome ubiquinol oxidase subunit I [Algiphilus acroporae]MCI5062691.1 cytochrome ubiquinol oxidase subunit I [Algiphilus sp.]MCI5104147.1 cytochrome ubiquinol oxidase subunit I [Algiphilus sp.]MCR9091570.1 cytochrome ubiquinol oxidase subunit I [Pseudomonadota bacterium]